MGHFIDREYFSLINKFFSSKSSFAMFFNITGDDLSDLYVCFKLLTYYIVDNLLVKLITFSRDGTHFQSKLLNYKLNR